MSKQHAVITGLAVRVPGTAVTQEFAAQFAASLSAQSTRQNKVISEIYRRSGVARRNSTLVRGDSGRDGEFFSKGEAGGPGTAERMERYKLDAPALALSTAREALPDAQVEGAQITHLITVSCTGFSAPGFDVDLILNLPLPPTVQRTHVGFMGCHGALNALRVARALVADDPDNRVLVCCVELCTLHFQYAYDANNVVANSLFADGAAAVVIESGSQHKSTNPIGCLAGTHSIILPDSRELMTWTVGDHGFQMTLSGSVPELVRQSLPAVVNPWLAAHQLTVQDIRGWAIHPGGPRIVDAVTTSLKLDDKQSEPSRTALSHHGNMSSPTVLFILDALRQRSEGHLPCVIMAFGPGLTIELTLLT